MKAFILSAFLLFSAQFAQAQITDGHMRAVLLQIGAEVKTYVHPTASMTNAYLILKGTHSSVGMGIGPTVNPYLAWQPELITDAVIIYQVNDFIMNGLKRDPPQRIVAPAYSRLVQLLFSLQASRILPPAP